MQTVSIFVAVALIILLFFGNRLSIHFPGEKSQGETSTQQNSSEKEENRLSGSWHYSVSQTSGPGSHNYSGTTTISQRGSLITISVQGRSLRGSIQGNNISVSGSYSGGTASMHGTVRDDNYISFSITVRIDDQRWTGRAIFTR